MTDSGPEPQGIIERQQARILGLTANSTCPYCGEAGRWHPMPGLAGLVVTDLTDDAVGAETLEDFDVIRRRAPVVGFACARCGFVRFHMIADD